MMEPLCEAVKVEVEEEPTGSQASSASQQPTEVDRVSDHSEDAFSQCDEIAIKEEEEEESMEDFDPVTGYTVFVPALKSKPSSTSDHSEDALTQCDEIGVKKEEEEEPIEDLDPVTGCGTFVPALKSKSKSNSGPLTMAGRTQDEGGSIDDGERDIELILDGDELELLDLDTEIESVYDSDEMEEYVPSKE
ncbi:uncharacterized protein LOC126986086, partial [Eriocheir sinensis]|uniref:uncharacterized protein LOC126986086 n=1 Tax=Eriocheir sinensis TaxID=95602 RepID=UPI0021C5F642